MNPIEYSTYMGPLPLPRTAEQFDELHQWLKQQTLPFVKITNVEVQTAQIADAAITTAKIDDLAVTDAKINSLAVSKLTAGTITSKGIVITGAGGYIQSGNYSAGSAGFKIDASDGSAEFNDVTVRGTLGAGTITGDLVISGGVIYTNTSGNIRTGLSGAGLTFYNASDVLQGALYYDSDVDALLVSSLDLALDASQDLILTASSNIILPAGGGSTPVDGWIETDYSGATGNWLEINAPYDSATFSQSKLHLLENGAFYFYRGATLDLSIISGIVKAAAGSASAPTYSFTSQSDTGIYKIPNDQIGFSSGGTLKGRFYSGGLLMGASATTGNVLLGTGSGSASAPNYTFYGDTDTGMYRINSNQIAFTAGETIQLRTGTASNPGIRIPDGSLTVPGLCFASDTDVGIYRPTSNQFGIGIATNNEFLLGATGCYIPNVFDYSPSGSANVVVDSDGLLHRASSSRRYKHTIKPWSGSGVLNIEPVTFGMYTQKQGEDGMPTKQKIKDGKTYLGAIAEQVHEVFPVAVVYNDEGEPEDIDWRAVTVALLGEVTRLEERLAVLEAA